MEYLSVIKINGFLSFVAMWLDHFIFSIVSRHRKSNVTWSSTKIYYTEGISPRVLQPGGDDS